MLQSIAMIMFVTVNTIASQLILKYGVQKITQTTHYTDVYGFLLKAMFSPIIISAVFLQGIGFVVWVFVVAKMKLGIAFAISGSLFYILMALSSWFFLGERINSYQWAGILLITCGVLLLTFRANY